MSERVRLGGGIVLISLSALVAGGALAARGAYRDDRGNLNVEAGPFTYGPCADLLDTREVRQPATDAQLVEGIRAIGRVCGFCAEDMAINVSGAPYEVCVDPESINLDYSMTPGKLTVTGYMMTNPPAPDGYLFTALDTNPGFCSALIGLLESNQNEYFARAFEPAMAAELVANVGIAPGSNSACEALPAPTTTAAP